MGQLVGARAGRKIKSSVSCDDTASTISTQVSDVTSASRHKLLDMSTNMTEDVMLSCNAEESKPATQQWLLIHLNQINDLVRELICPTCLNSTGLQVTIDSANQGFCSSVMLQCTHCQEGDRYRKSVYTSTRLQDSTRGDVAFDINVRMVLLAHEL